MSSAPPLGLTARATIHRVIDGDTLEVICLGAFVSIRLRDCWAPELYRGDQQSRARGEAAKRFMQSLAPEHADCIVRVDTADARRLGDLLTFGRVVGDVWMVGHDDSLSEQMVAQGHATTEKVVT